MRVLSDYEIEDMCTSYQNGCKIYDLQKEKMLKKARDRHLAGESGYGKSSSKIDDLCTEHKGCCKIYDIEAAKYLEKYYKEE